MSAKVSYWTDKRREELRAAYLQTIEEHGRAGIYPRVAESMNCTVAAVDSALRRLPDWITLQAKGLEVDDKRQLSELPPVAEILDPTDPTLRNLERKVLAQRDELTGLRKKLNHLDRQSGIIAELVTVAEGMIEPILPILNTNLHHRGDTSLDSREKVDAIVYLSDQHADRVIHATGTWGLEQYDFNVFRCRLWEWAKMIQRYTQVHLPNYDFETLWVWHLGDAIHGDIHDQKLRNHYANTLKASLAVGDVQAQAIAYLAPYFKRVVIVCVPGNHGRTTKQLEWEGPHDNFDYLVANIMKMRLKDHKNVQVFTPNAWSAHVEVRGWLWHLNHGMGVIGSMGVPWYGFEKREGRVQRLVSFKDRQVDYFAYGHFHTPMTRPTGRGKAIHAGAWFFTDAFSLNKLSVGNEPEQQLLVFSERFGRQIEIPLMIRDQKREAEFHAGKYEPPFGKELIIDEPGEQPGLREMPIIS